MLKNNNAETDLKNLSSFKKIIDNYIYSTGLSPEPFSSQFEKKIKNLVNREETLNTFLRFIENSFSKQTLFKALDDNTNVIDLLLLIFENSKYLSEILIREPNLLFWVLDKKIIDMIRTPEDYYNDLANTISVFISSDKKVDAIKRYYRHNILRIGIRDLFINAGIETITSELSGLADSIIRVVTELAYSEIRKKYGKIPKTDFVIFGLGKLGGEELNYSSDIDIIMSYRDDGEFRSSEKKVIANFDFFQELGRNIIRILTETSHEGYLYRVDMRLRPEGNSGPLVPSYAYMLSYYESRGEIWERQMLIKARVIYDQNGYGVDVMKNLSSFIYPKFPLKNPLEEIAKIKFRIESGNDKSQNIKLCKGGIRDIEFSLQALQLLNGGKRREVRERNTLRAVDGLRQEELLSINEAKIIKKAYMFYRAIEHRLQIKQYHQTFILPSESQELLRLSKSMGFKNSGLFNRKLNLYLNEIRKIFKRVFKIDIQETLADIERIINNDSAKSIKTLIKYGFDDPASLKFVNLIIFGSSDSESRKYPTQLSELAKEVLSVLLNKVKKMPNKLQILKNFEYLISRRGDVEAFLRLLFNEQYLHNLLLLCCYSNAFSKILSESDKLLEIINNLGLEKFEHENAEELSVSENIQLLLVRSVIKDLDGKYRAGKLYSTISNDIDEILVSLYDRLNVKRCGSLKYSIFALGKLGSYEMGINSDLDLFFIYESESEKDLEASIKFFEDYVDLVNKESKNLFELDLRLRPEGKNAPIAIEKEAFFEYLKNRASLWEKLALTRARNVAGDKALANEVIESINKFISIPLTKFNLNEIMSMRKNIELKAIKLDQNSIDIKVMEGGLVDIEFAAQVLKIILFDKNKSILKKNSPQVISFAEKKGILSASDADFMIDTYFFYRDIEKYIALNNLSERYIFRLNDSKIEPGFLGYESRQTLFIEIKKRMFKIRKIYNSLFKKFERFV